MLRLSPSQPVSRQATVRECFGLVCDLGDGNYTGREVVVKWSHNLDAFLATGEQQKAIHSDIFAADAPCWTSAG
jgi:hypothetical protein